MGYVLDLDVLKPEERKLTLGGKEFDLTEIPMILASEFMDMREEMMTIVTDETINREVYLKIMDLFARILQLSHPDIDRDWLVKRITISRLKPFLDFILESIIGVKKNEDEEPEDSSSSV